MPFKKTLTIKRPRHESSSGEVRDHGGILINDQRIAEKWLLLIKSQIQISQR
jgi:hypothetical protein